jgi:trehalose/maltose hydrolase-like predicted phosphorylase
VAANIPLERFPDGTTRENISYGGVPIKQADVNLLAYPLALVTDPRAVRRDLAYYEARLAPDGPAMSWSILATLYARQGDAAKAFSLFQRSYLPNALPPFGVLAEAAGGDNPYFATGAGGTLQAVLFGFGGLRVEAGGVRRTGTVLPPHWRSITIRHLGQAY